MELKCWSVDIIRLIGNEVIIMNNCDMQILHICKSKGKGKTTWHPIITVLKQVIIEKNLEANKTLFIFI